jgi:hypothetical protein
MITGRVELARSLRHRVRPVVAGQVQVEHDQVGARLVEDLPHPGAVGRGERAVAVRLEIFGQQGADVAVVVDDQNGRRSIHGRIIAS